MLGLPCIWCTSAVSTAEPTHSGVATAQCNSPVLAPFLESLPPCTHKLDGCSSVHAGCRCTFLLQGTITEGHGAGRLSNHLAAPMCLGYSPQSADH